MVCIFGESIQLLAQRGVAHVDLHAVSVKLVDVPGIAVPGQIVVGQEVAAVVEEVILFRMRRADLLVDLKAVAIQVGEVVEGAVFIIARGVVDALEEHRVGDFRAIREQGAQ